MSAKPELPAPWSAFLSELNEGPSSPAVLIGPQLYDLLLLRNYDRCTVYRIVVTLVLLGLIPH